MTDQKQIQEVAKKVDQLVFYLHNDEATGKVGIIGQVEILTGKLDRYIENQKIEKAARKAEIKVWSLVGSSVVTSIVFLIQFLMK